MKVESVILVIVAICVFLTFYFSLLSFTSPEDIWRKQFINLAVYSLITGITVFACLLSYMVVKKVFAKTFSNTFKPRLCELRNKATNADLKGFKWIKAKVRKTLPKQVQEKRKAER